MTRTAREVVELYNLVVWNTRDLDLAEELLGDNVTRHEVGEAVVLTHAQAVQRIVDHLAMFDDIRFDLNLVVAGDDVTRPKPFPDPYLQACTTLGVDPVDAVAIEDSPTGVRAAASAGVTTIGVPLMVPLDGVGAHVLWPTLEGRTTDDLRAVHAARRTNRDEVSA